MPSDAWVDATELSGEKKKEQSPDTVREETAEPAPGTVIAQAGQPDVEGSPCSQAHEQPDAPPAVGTGAASVMTEPADITACPSGLPRHRNDIQDNDKIAEGGCPSSCPPAEQAEAGAPGAQAVKGMRRRWQQASLARTGEPSDSGEPRETDTPRKGKGRPPPLRLVEGPF